MCKKFVFRALILCLVFFVKIHDGFAQTENGGFELNIKSPEDIAATYAWTGSQDWGGSIEEDFCGRLVWAENGAETEGCDPLASSSDLTGKIALIRRGTCDFSLKAYHAQQAGAKALVIVNHNDSGDPDEFVTMLGGDSASTVDIPVVFITYNSGMIIIPFLAEGNEVEVCFEFPTFNLAFGPYSYFTPLSQVIPLDNMQVRVTNRGAEDKNNIESKVLITEPDGNLVELVSMHSAPIGEEIDVAFESYTPSQIGKYNMKFVSGHDSKEIVRDFEITEHTWGMDNGEIVRAVGPSTARFQDASFFYQHANLVLTNTSTIATHVTFGIGNGADVFVDDPSSDLILVAIYDGDKNEDGAVDGFTTFDDLGDPLEIGFYELNGSETFENLITVAFENSVELKANGIYYVSLAYDGINAGTGVAPSFSASNSEAYLNFPSTPLELDEFFGGGWASSTLVTRLHLEGFVTSTKDIEPLAADKVRILSNPVVNEELRFEIELENSNDQVDILFRNLEGKLLEHKQYQNVTSVADRLDVTGLPSGTYFLNINTDEGFRSEKVIILR